MSDLSLEELKTLSKKDRMVAKYMEEIKRVNEDPDFYEFISAEEDNRKIENSIREEMIEKGLKEGLERGLEQGLEQGKEEANKQVVVAMLKDNVKLSDITKYTGVDSLFIKKCQEELIERN